MKETSGSSLMSEDLIKVYKKYQIAWHLLFWATYVAYESLVWGMVDEGYTRRFISSLVELPLKIAATYFTIYILINKFLVRKKYLLFFLYGITSVVVFVVALRVLVFHVIYAKYYPEAMETIPMLWPPKLLITFAYMYSIVAIASAFHMISLWVDHQLKTQKLIQTAEKLEKENATAQLQLLKSQINPHFLFNTLNNLYTLALSKSDKTPEIIHKLSDLMSFMLYDSNHEKVTLEKEIKYLEDYIALEKIRYDEGTDVMINVSGATGSVMIPPLLLLPLVENGFKHGLSRQLDQGWMHIAISANEGKLIAKVENSKNENEPAPNPASGLGLSNLKKRLALIYPEKHELKIFNESDTYLAVLKIDLLSHESE